MMKLVRRQSVRAGEIIAVPRSNALQYAAGAIESHLINDLIAIDSPADLPQEVRAASQRETVGDACL